MANQLQEYMMQTMPSFPGKADNANRSNASAKIQQALTQTNQVRQQMGRTYVITLHGRNRFKLLKVFRIQFPKCKNKFK